MRAALICATLFAVGIGVMGCGAVPEPPLACTEEGWALGPQGEFRFQYCEALGMECNEAVTLAAECPGFMNELEQYIREILLPMIVDRLPFLPSFIDPEELVAMLFDRYVGVCGDLDILQHVGTCQPLGNLEDPCAEDGDCLEGLVCLGGMCAVPEEPGCMSDEDCDPGLVCQEGACVVQEQAGCLADEDCDPGLVCDAGMCVDFQDGSCLHDADCAAGLVCMQGSCVVPPPQD